jgi:hypothetical protein
MGLSNRVKARASRSLDLTHLLKPAPCSVASGPSVGGCQGWRSHREAGPRSGVLYSTGQTLNNRYSTLVGIAVTKVRPKPLFFARLKPILVEVPTFVTPQPKAPVPALLDPKKVRNALSLLCRLNQPDSTFQHKLVVLHEWGNQ